MTGVFSTAAIKVYDDLDVTPGQFDLSISEIPAERPVVDQDNALPVPDDIKRLRVRLISDGCLSHHIWLANPCTLSDLWFLSSFRGIVYEGQPSQSQSDKSVKALLYMGSETVCWCNDDDLFVPRFDLQMGPNFVLQMGITPFNDFRDVGGGDVDVGPPNDLTGAGHAQGFLGRGPGRRSNELGNADQCPQTLFSGYHSLLRSIFVAPCWQSGTVKPHYTRHQIDAVFARTYNTRFRTLTIFSTSSTVL
jgi:hypothetical protein